MNDKPLYVLLVGVWIVLVINARFGYCQTTNHWIEKDSLLGEYWGKDKLFEHGITFDMIYTGEFFSNVRGGINTHDAREYRGDWSVLAELDTTAAGLWDNGLFYLHLQEQHGKGITNMHTGDFQVLSNIDADDYHQISELWYQHSYLDERLWIKFGKMEANSDFAFVNYGVEFINSSPGFSPSIPLTTYPDQDLGIVIGVVPVDWFSLNLGVFQGNPNGGRSIGNAFGNLDGPMVMIEPAWHYHFAGLPGHLRFGGWWNGVEFDHVDGVSGSSETQGWYTTLDQMVWKENTEVEDEQGIGLFAQAGFSDEEYIQAKAYFGGGMQWLGAIESRDNDITGFGVFHVEFSGLAGFVDNSETTFELFYKWQAAGWMSIKPDIQYILNPGGIGNDDAIAIGVRWDIVF